MSESRPTPANRRQVLAAMAMGGSALALGLVASPKGALAQEAADYSDHPLTGMWLAMANPALPENPPFAVPSLFGADGTVYLAFPPVDVGADGVFFQSAATGVWAPHDDRTGHFTVVITNMSAEGLQTGTTTINGFPSVNEDNMTFTDRNDLTHVTIRDASGLIVVEPPPDPSGRAVTGIRMAVDAPGFPEMEPEGSPSPEA